MIHGTIVREGKQTIVITTGSFQHDIDRTSIFLESDAFLSNHLIGMSAKTHHGTCCITTSCSITIDHRVGRILWFACIGQGMALESMDHAPVRDSSRERHNDKSQGSRAEGSHHVKKKSDDDNDAQLVSLLLP